MGEEGVELEVDRGRDQSHYDVHSII